MSKRSITIGLVIIILLLGAGGVYYFTQVQYDRPSQDRDQVSDAKSSEDDQKEAGQEQNMGQDTSPEEATETDGMSLEKKIERALDVNNYTDCQDCSGGDKKIYNGVAIDRRGRYIYGAPNPTSTTRWEFQVVPWTLFIEVKVDSKGEVINRKEISNSDFELHDSVSLVALQESTSTTPTAMLVKRIIEEE